MARGRFDDVFNCEGSPAHGACSSRHGGRIDIYFDSVGEITRGCDRGARTSGRRGVRDHLSLQHAEPAPQPLPYSEKV